MTELTPLWMRALTGDTEIDYDASAYRQVIDAGWTLPGIVNGGDLLVSQRGAGANLSVDVAAGTSIIQGLVVTNQGKYLCESDGVVNVSAAANPSSGNVRIDSIVGRLWDAGADSNSNTGSARYCWQLIYVQGTQATSNPSPPTLPTAMAGTVAGYIELARISRTASDVSVATAAITDVRALAVGNSDRTVGRFNQAGASGTLTGVETSLGSAFRIPGIVLNAARRYRIELSGELGATVTNYSTNVVAAMRIRAGTTTAATVLAFFQQTIIITGGPGQDTFTCVTEVAPGVLSTGLYPIQLFLWQSAGSGAGLAMESARLSVTDIGT